MLMDGGGGEGGEDYGGWGDGGDGGDGGGQGRTMGGAALGNTMLAEAARGVVEAAQGAVMEAAGKVEAARAALKLARASGNADAIKATEATLAASEAKLAASEAKLAAAVAMLDAAEAKLASTTEDRGGGGGGGGRFKSKGVIQKWESKRSGVTRVIQKRRRSLSKSPSAASDVQIETEKVIQMAAIQREMAELRWVLDRRSMSPPPRSSCTPPSNSITTPHPFPPPPPLSSFTRTICSCLICVPILRSHYTNTILFKPRYIICSNLRSIKSIEGGQLGGAVAKTQLSKLRQGFELEDACGEGSISREKVMSIIKVSGLTLEGSQLEWLLDNVMFHGKATSSSSSSSSSPPPTSPSSSSSPKSSPSSPSSRVEKERGGGQRRVHTGRRGGEHASLEGEGEAESGERSGGTTSKSDFSGLTGFSGGDVDVWDGTFTTTYSTSQNFAAVGLAVLGTRRVAAKWRGDKSGGGGGGRDAGKTTSAGGGGMAESQKSKHSKDMLDKQLARATEEGAENRSGKGAARGKKAKKKEAQVRE